MFFLLFVISLTFKPLLEAIILGDETTFNASNVDLKNMIKDRAKHYAKASFKIECDHLTKKELTDKILDIYETN